MIDGEEKRLQGGMEDVQMRYMDGWRRTGAFPCFFILDHFVQLAQQHTLNNCKKYLKWTSLKNLCTNIYLTPCHFFCECIALSLSISFGVCIGFFTH